MSDKYVLRYAPSPTGPQHIGGVRTALYCHFLAQQKGGELILRIEDTDQGRFVEGAEQFIIDACNWVGIKFTQGVHIGGPHAPYRQSERMGIYKQYADQLLEAGHAYIAFDTPAELTDMRQRLEEAGADNRTYNYMTRQSMRNSLTLSKEEVDALIADGIDYVVRFKVPEKAEVRFVDEIRGHMHFHGSHVDDKVLLKSDGLPTYHLANVVDDHLMEITHVIRGEEWLPSTPLHVLLYRAFGWEKSMPKFAHLALLLSPSGGKLSKRQADKYGIPVFPNDWLDHASGETWKGYKSLGYFPEALVNFLALLGWHPGGEQELLSMDDLIGSFSLDRAHHAGAKVDMAKLNSFQQHYLRLKSPEELAELLKPMADEAGLSYPNQNFLVQVMAMMRERITFVKDVLDAEYFFQAPTSYNEKMARKNWKEVNRELLTDFRTELAAQSDWNSQTIHDLFHAFLEAKEAGAGKLMAPLRLALTGLPSGPGCFEIAEALGQEESIARIDSALLNLSHPD